MTGVADTVGALECLPGRPCAQIAMDGIDITPSSSKDEGWECEAVQVAAEGAVEPALPPACKSDDSEPWVSRYDTTFTAPANASAPLDSEGWSTMPASWSGMPLGDGDTVSLTSVDSRGQLGFLLGKADAYDEFHELIKVGRVLVDMTPPLVGADFRQTLHYANASMTVSAGGYHVVLWLAQGTLHVEASRADATPFSLRARIDIWRNASYLVPSYGGGPCGCGACNKSLHVRHADTVVKGDAPLWYHRNELRPEVFSPGDGSLWAQELRFAGLGSAIDRGLSRDPLTNKTFGALLRGESVGGRQWRALDGSPGIETSASVSAPAVLSVHVLSAQTETAAEYEHMLRQKARTAPALAQARAANGQEWARIWGRSRLQVLKSTNATQNVTHTTAMYVATRFIALLEQRGGPKKFNGGILNPDLGSEHDRCSSVPPGGVGGQCSADYRGWSGAFWFQNTR